MRKRKINVPGILATIALIILYLIYRISQTFVFWANVKSFNAWLKYSSNQDHVVSVLFMIVFTLHLFFGWLIAFGVIIFFYLLFFIKQWLKKRKQKTNTL